MRKPQIQPSLASLTLAEREQLADWLRREEYTDVLARVNQPRPQGFGLDISIKPLWTFYAKVALFDLINSRLPETKKISFATFETLARRDLNLLTSAEDESLAAAHASILRTVADLATAGDNSTTQLLHLQRLADFPARSALRDQMAELRTLKAEIQLAREDRAQAREKRAAEMHTHKIALDLRKQDRADRAEQRATEHLDLAKKLADQKLTASNSNSALSTQNSALRSDHLGPIATDWKGVGERVCKLFGITPEEEARRAELHKTWKDPHARPGIPEEINPVD